ncbi:MAG: biotin transporter BioY [Enterococcus lactis]
MNRTLKELILAAEFAAIISVFSQMTIPFGLVPLTGQTFAIGLTATFLGRKLGLISVTVYLLLGLIGLPVFSGMTGGIAVLFGPTGGYLIGFLFQTWLTGWMIEKTDAHYLYAIFANLMGSLAALVCGTIWLKISGDLTFTTAFASGLLPFLLPEAIKAIGAAYIGVLMKKRLNRFLRTN